VKGAGLMSLRSAAGGVVAAASRGWTGFAVRGWRKTGPGNGGRARPSENFGHLIPADSAAAGLSKMAVAVLRPSRGSKSELEVLIGWSLELPAGHPGCGS